MTAEPHNDDREPTPPDRRGPAKHAPGTRKPETTPAEERGERLDVGKTISRGGKTEGHVPGAEPAAGESAE